MKAAAKPQKAGAGVIPQGVGGVRNEDNRFRLCLAAALLAHAMFLAGFYTAPTRQLGSPGGDDNAISVDLATNADLNGTATVSDSGSGAMKPTLDAAAAPEPAEAPAPEPAPVEPTLAEPPRPPLPQVADLAKLPEPEKSPHQPTQPKPEAAPQSTLRPEDLTLPDLDTALQKASPPPKAAPTPQKQEHKAETKPQEQKQEQKQAQVRPKPNPVPQPRLDLSLPQSAFERQTFVGGGGGIERPAGITRSGENDDFARNVIRALQRTMPQLSNTRGRVTVRILLDDRGNLVSTQVVRKSDIAGLDQNVVFATKQTSFPIPPRQHVSADLVFLVTYIYH